MIHLGDCIEVMAGLDADSVDAVVTDPPYGLEFMGKEWDRFSPVDAKRGRWKHAASSGHGITKREEGTQTHPGAGHRVSYHERRQTSRCTVCDRRDAFRSDHGHGDAWVQEWVDPYPLESMTFQAWCEAWGREALRVTKPGGYLLAFGGTRTHHRLVCGLEDAGWIIRDELDWIYASGFPKGKANLKPAHEPIVLARKPGPLRPLAIDACRIPTDERLSFSSAAPFTDANGEQGRTWNPTSTPGIAREQSSGGRWPSNLLLQDPELFDAANPGVVGSGAVTSTSEPHRLMDPNPANDVYGQGMGHKGPGYELTGYGDTGGYSRFFIIPKADRADREPVLRGQLPKTGTGLHDDDNYRQPGERKANHTAPMPRENAHPTVKPVDLMRHLVRLVTPPGGTVLDCFLGSGSTAIACEMEGFPWVGIEQSPEYVAIAEARLNGVQRGLGLDVPAPTQTRKESKPGWHQRPTSAEPGFRGPWSGTPEPEEAA